MSKILNLSMMLHLNCHKKSVSSCQSIKSQKGFTYWAFVIIALVIALVTLLAIVIFQLQNPQYLDFKYKLATIPVGARIQLGQNLANGTMSLNDANLGGTTNCEYIATNMASKRDLDSAVSSNVATITIEADLENTALTPCSTATPFVVDLFDVAVSQLPATGGTQNFGSGSLIMVSGSDGTKLYQIDPEIYFSFTLDSLDGAYATGSFEFIATNANDPSDPQVLLVFDGDYGLD